MNPEILFPISTPPFYATKITGATFLTVCGGLRTDENMQVCDENDTSIEGLYNTGIMTLPPRSGWQRRALKGEVHSPFSQATASR